MEVWKAQETIVGDCCPLALRSITRPECCFFTASSMWVSQLLHRLAAG